MRIVGNFNIDTIYYVGLSSMISLVLGFVFMIVSIIFKFKNWDKESSIIKMLSNSLYVRSIVLLIFWSTFLIINQINNFINLIV